MNNIQNIITWTAVAVLVLLFFRQRKIIKNLQKGCSLWERDYLEQYETISKLRTDIKEGHQMVNSLLKSLYYIYSETLYLTEEKDMPIELFKPAYHDVFHEFIKHIFRYDEIYYNYRHQIDSKEIAYDNDFIPFSFLEKHFQSKFGDFVEKTHNLKERKGGFLKMWQSDEVIGKIDIMEMPIGEVMCLLRDILNFKVPDFSERYREWIYYRYKNYIDKIDLENNPHFQTNNIGQYHK